MECVEPFCGIARCLGPPVCNYFKYHRKLNDYVRNFKRIRDELNCKMEDIELQLKAELRRPLGKIAKKGVENWLKDVKEMISEAQVVENKVSNGRYLCRACNGKLVDEKTREMKELLGKAPNASEGLVVDGPSRGLLLPTSELVGQEAVRNKIWACLMQEEVSKIGVWGMGGVGKTAIMKHIHNKLLEEQRFKRVIWVTISKEFNVMKVQDDIASALGLKEYLNKEEDKLRRAAILSEMLKRAGKHVLILDDVWYEFPLEEVGIPEPSGSNGCKLVLTTRSKLVCECMGSMVLKVKRLLEKEALTLFLNIVGRNIVQSPTIMPTLKLVVKECAALPLTIVVVAGTMKGEDDPHIWKTAHEDLKERIGKVEGVEAKVIECLKFSFDHLKDGKVKDCFLYCALYPQDFGISKDELIECWIDEGFINEMDTRQEMEDKGLNILKKLEDNCLLENSTTKSSSHCVKMHDAVRDMALSITRMNPRYMIQAGLRLDKLPEKEQWSPDIEKHNPFKKIPYSFFANMPCLSVLNLSFTNIKSLRNSISELKNLTTLLLRGCAGLRDLPCLSMLKELKKLDLCWTSIEEVPEGMDMLIKLRYIDLGVDNEKISLKAEEVVPLEKLEWFNGRFKEINELNKFISSMQQSKKNLIKYHLQLGIADLYVGRDKRLTIGKVHNWEGELIMLPIDIQQLHISDFHYMRSLGDSISCLTNAVDLTTCSIQYCDRIECVVSLSSFTSSSTHPFQSLEVLVLDALPKLSALIIKDEGFGSTTTSTLAPCATFSHLKEITLIACSSMKTVLPHWLLPNLQNLEEISVYHCDESICSKYGVMVCDSLQLIEVDNGCYELKKIPPFVPLVGDGQPYAYAPPSLTISSNTEWWESLEWNDHPNFKNVLQPLWKHQKH
ncbi:disease resistance protein At4g27190-like [Gossypium hirsutum]|uniref:Disease resistance protein At4g27190-like n=1 Tax=Gossypium hirsutum TaxID=3635 RepID=A0A1U8NJA5_GOSHI|nr:disease resistance protein At4g27190-like [Gossypium hirsutum]